jgi:RNA polymerase sigma factor (sigma-70 family)
MADRAPEPQRAEDEGALLRACLEGDGAAFERLVARHRRLVEQAVRRALAASGAAGDDDLCEEAAASAFSTLAEDDFRVLRSFAGRSRLSTFVAAVAARVALRTLERRRPRGGRRAGVLGAGAGADADGAPEPVAPGPGPRERAEAEEERAIVREAVALLSPRDALALRLFYEQGLGHREIGAVLGVPVTHVGQILARAREKVRVRIERAGLRAGGDDEAS